MGSPPSDGITCTSTEGCPTSGACASYPVCWTHETPGPNGESYCAEQVPAGELGTAPDACGSVVDDTWVDPKAPYVNCWTFQPGDFGWWGESPRV